MNGKSTKCTFCTTGFLCKDSIDSFICWTGSNNKSPKEPGRQGPCYFEVDISIFDYLREVPLSFELESSKESFRSTLRAQALKETLASDFLDRLSKYFLYKCHLSLLFPDRFVCKLSLSCYSAWIKRRIQ